MTDACFVASWQASPASAAQFCWNRHAAGDVGSCYGCAEIFGDCGALQGIDQRACEARCERPMSTSSAAPLAYATLNYDLVNAGREVIAQLISTQEGALTRAMASKDLQAGRCVAVGPWYTCGRLASPRARFSAPRGLAASSFS